MSLYQLLQEHSLLYEKRGWVHTPCYIYHSTKTGKKTPLFLSDENNKTWTVLNTRTQAGFIDLYERLKVQKKREPNAIAILTGEISNLFVLDLDNPVKEGLDFCKKLGAKLSSKGYGVQTQSLGLQLYYTFDVRLAHVVTTKAKLTDPVTGNKLPLDIRGNGGIVFAPPSRFLGGDNKTHRYKTYNIDAELPPIPETIVEYLLKIPQSKDTEKSLENNYKPTAELSALSEKQQALYSEKLSAAHTASKGSRSEADMKFICCAALFNIDPEVIYSDLSKGGKVAELESESPTKARKYYEYTLGKALKYLSSNPRTAAVINSRAGSCVTSVQTNGVTTQLQYYKFWTFVRDATGKVVAAHIKATGVGEFCRINNILTDATGEFENTVYLLIHIKDRLANYITYTSLEKLCVEYVRSLVVAGMLSSENSLHIIEAISAFDKRFSVALPLYHCKMKRLCDNAKSIYLFFTNCYIEATSTGHTVHEYRDIPEEYYIPSNRMCRSSGREFASYQEPGTHSGMCDFEQFVCDITGHVDPHNMDTLYKKRSVEAAIGYLISTYKNPSKNPCIILSDKMTDTDDITTAQGGRGKGITASAVGYVRDVVLLDGRSFEKSQFTWQRVSTGTNVIVIDDVKSNFPLESVYSDITEGLTIEKKHKQATFVGFRESPKIMFTTNYAFKVKGVSAVRRTHEIDLEPFYNNENTPTKRFGHTLFDSWDTEEWNRFFEYMARCCTYYMTAGLGDTVPDSIRYKRLIVGTSTDFVSYCDSELVYGEYMSVSSFRDGLIACAHDLNTNHYTIRESTIRTYMQDYCDYHGHKIEFVRKRVNNSTNPISAYIVRRAGDVVTTDLDMSITNSSEETVEVDLCDRVQPVE